MDLFIAKKNNHALSNWSTRCYRLRNCELIQYKKGIDDFKLCKDEVIKARHNICDIEQILLNPKTPYVLKINIPTKYQQNSVNCIFLKFNEVNANVNKKNTKKAQRANEKDRNHVLFAAIYRLMAASSKSSSECLERPLPSNICVALYYLLQKLYKNPETVTTKFIFKETIPNLESAPKRLKFFEKLYYNLVVNSERFVTVDDHDDYDLDPEALSTALIYTLQHMPTSLFCDSYCKDLTEFVAKTMADDDDITHLATNKRVGKIKTFLIQKYSARKMEFRKTHGFHLFNRYGFMAILFTLLHHIQCKRYMNSTEMSAYDLAKAIAPCLQSKRYLFICKSEQLNKSRGYRKTRRDEPYERQFVTMVQVLIYYAPALFPDLKRVNWKVQSLIHCQGQERMLMRYYNDQYSLNTKNKYYIASILRKGTNYGHFDGNIRDLNQQKVSRSDAEVDRGSQSSSASDAVAPQKDKKYIVRVDEQYTLKKQLSYHEHPAYHSDLGVSELSDVAELVEEEKEIHKAKKNKHDYLQTERDYDADTGGDNEEDEDATTDMKYPDLLDVKETAREAANRLIPNPKPRILTQSDIGYTSDNEEDLNAKPPNADIQYDGESISEQSLSESSDSKEPQPKQVDTNVNIVRTNDYDYDINEETYDDFDDETLFDQCESCIMAPLLRLFGYAEDHEGCEKL